MINSNIVVTSLKSFINPKTKTVRTVQGLVLFCCFFIALFSKLLHVNVKRTYLRLIAGVPGSTVSVFIMVIQEFCVPQRLFIIQHIKFLKHFHHDHNHHHYCHHCQNSATECYRMTTLLLVCERIPVKILTCRQAILSMVFCNFPWPL